jgi:hypothetical protein
MVTSVRMPRYDVRNDGAGPYAVFYCDSCGREFRGQPDITNTLTQNVGRQALGGLLRRVPIVGSAVADNVTSEDPRYSYKLTPQQLDKAWVSMQDRFRQCPTCDQVVCLSCWDAQSGTCNDDSPRKDEIDEATGAQAGAAIKGFASALGLGAFVQQASQAAQQAQQEVGKMARCPKDGTLAPAGTKFCPECGSPMAQPVSDACPKCGTDVKGAKFCPNCGTKIERAPAVTKCPQCGAESKGSKFCPECGAKMG